MTRLTDAELAAMEVEALPGSITEEWARLLNIPRLRHREGVEGDGMIVLVCGGRDYEDAMTVFTTLGTIHAKTPITCIVEGGARGADRLGRHWAEARYIPVKTHEANWQRWGKAAGLRRNEEMLRLNKIDLVVAFPGGAGTADMKRRAILANIPLREI